MTARRIPMEAALLRQNVPSSFACRPVAPSDADALATLLYVAYRGTIDDEGDSLADARAEIEKTFRGGYGRFLPECSFVIEDGEFLTSACLVTFFEPHAAPLIVFLMTRPEAKRRGLARRLLEQSTNALLDAGYDRLTLVVTDGNDPAQRLYASFGFRPILGGTARGSVPM
ncbi:MAG: GNAT family N-acetyltransferase [Candidatus Bipolaricaulis sp.]|nr:GNAT family N-acetyltransferase [Candidatus Bipolaricaulis sp.]